MFMCCDLENVSSEFIFYHKTTQIYFLNSFDVLSANGTWVYIMIQLYSTNVTDNYMTTWIQDIITNFAHSSILLKNYQ